MARSIKIRWATSHYRTGQDDGVRVRFNVVCATDMATKVFAYRMLPLNPTGSATGHFSHICSPPDVEEYPEDGPTDGSCPEWFRLNYVDVLVRSVAEAVEFIQIVIEDVRRLKQTYDQMDAIFVEGTEIIGVDCDPPTLSSASASAASTSSASLSAGQVITVIGTSEQSVGFGVPWVNIGDGAGSPVGNSDSLALNRSRVELCSGQASQLLLVQGFDLSTLADDAIIDGVGARLVLRDANAIEVASSSLSSAGTSSLSAAALQCPRLSFLALQHPERGLSDNRGENACIDGPAWQILSHGGDNDLWGFPALTGADLKKGAFGLSLVIDADFFTREAVAEVDGVELDIYYREVI